MIFVKNNIKYAYSFTCDKDKVYKESLYIDENNRSATVFERSNVYDYEFKQDKTLLEDIKQKNTSNKLFLTTAATWNYNRVKPVVEYILNDLVAILDYNINLPKMLDEFKNSHEYDEFKRFALKILEQGDFTISDFLMSNSKIDSNDPKYNELLNMFKRQFPNDLQFDSIDLNEIKFNTIHNIKEKNVIKPYTLDLDLESLGTVNLFKFTAILFDVLKKGKTLVVDEINRSLHPLLVEYIINLFVDKNINKKNAQLIFNTHDTNLLSLDLFRRDEIWFAERNIDTGASNIYPLTDYSPRKDENIQKGYLIGRYGAIPFINGDNCIWQE